MSELSGVTVQKLPSDYLRLTLGVNLVKGLLFSFAPKQTNHNLLGQYQLQQVPGLATATSPLGHVNGLTQGKAKHLITPLSQEHCLHTSSDGTRVPSLNF